MIKLKSEHNFIEIKLKPKSKLSKNNYHLESPNINLCKKKLNNYVMKATKVIHTHAFTKIF